MRIHIVRNPGHARLSAAGVKQKNWIRLASWQAALALLGMLIVSGCSSTPESTHHSSHAAAPAANSLRVAVAPDYPPLVFTQGDHVTGAEVDLANLLGKELNRPVEFITLKRDDLINALQDGRADIVMSGMSVTKARQIRAKFSEPYLHNQLRAIFKRADAGRFQTAQDILTTGSRIGVLAGSTSDVFVQKNCPDAQRVAVQNRRDVPFWLTDGGKLELYVDDSFALAQIVSAHEAALAYLPQPLAEDDLAWAVAPGDDHLLQQVNEVLGRWKGSRLLETVLVRWMPYLKKL